MKQYSINMIQILRYWRDKTKEQRQEIKTKIGVTVMTYEIIQKLYNENTKK